ncbi:hypothetical protein K2Z84_22175 [Candidatus Binatia bacterium]|nr:hypothetical protein [Candidatus Binatia bacterium]
MTNVVSEERLDGLTDPKSGISFNPNDISEGGKNVMIPTIPVAVTAAPATAAIATTGLEPLLWLTLGLMAAAVALIVREAWSQTAEARVTPIDDAPRVRLHVVQKPPKPLLDAA